MAGGAPAAPKRPFFESPEEIEQRRRLGLIRQNQTGRGAFNLSGAFGAAQPQPTQTILGG
jgi:hypothetical protein